ncbi:hypothetical protein CAEBREN_32401 [Caenorhabditis brenneri]|uniref:Uncharacterized protein n=1 Tax=Caenorhabditis brenneri TaxID=135651 RepID=G0NXT2_CAEBE|nr:hypothetical protein CAEBREN_32401 [Caenorhabditis brenneri]
MPKNNEERTKEKCTEKKKKGWGWMRMRMWWWWRCSVLFLYVIQVVRFFSSTTNISVTQSFMPFFSIRGPFLR